MRANRNFSDAGPKRLHSVIINRLISPSDAVGVESPCWRHPYSVPSTPIVVSIRHFVQPKTQHWKWHKTRDRKEYQRRNCEHCYVAANSVRTLQVFWSRGASARPHFCNTGLKAYYPKIHSTQLTTIEFQSSLILLHMFGSGKGYDTLTEA